MKTIPTGCHDCSKVINEYGCVLMISRDHPKWRDLLGKLFVDVSKNIKSKVIHPECPREDVRMREKLKQL